MANQKQCSVQCIVPSKLILSGEHAVLYDCPALSMATDLATNCTLSRHPSDTAKFTIQLNDFDLTKTFTFEQWQQQAQQIESRYQAFRHNKLPIDGVLNSPFDLVLMTLWIFNQQHAIQPADWKISVQSDAPIGRGLGSSAAVIVGLLSGLFNQHKIPSDKASILRQAQQVECYQHGKSSGLDPATLIYGGLLKYQLDQPIQSLENQPISGWLIDTGAPSSHTGECVQTVKQHYQHDTQLWQSFKETSFEIEQAWSKHNIDRLKQALRHNHQLLCKIGVVPNKVQAFIQKLDTKLNSASKVCGAGSVEGNSAGMVLCLSEASPAELCQQYGYEFWPLQLQPQGVQCELV